MFPTDLADAEARFHILDVREQDEWDAGHIEGAQHIPLGELAVRLDELPGDKVILCVCRSGKRSELARRALDGLGIAAENLEGGVQDWVRGGRGLVTRDGTPGRAI